MFKYFTLHQWTTVLVSVYGLGTEMKRKMNQGMFQDIDVLFKQAWDGEFYAEILLPSREIES